MIRRYTIHFLTQEEPGDGNADNRKVLTQGCPSFGHIEWFSDKDDPTELYESFRDWIKSNTEHDLAKRIVWPKTENDLE
jgi:hypothetical protein